ncbi:MAG: hypothetical protein A2Z20_11545 [Bdellovibrionales bacterium RBG_16_40_8]|nr:MAG: hypothetical protein A2Z20_11545 [Bdellovibrionales bacterium RBG_16_40_8]
MANKAKVWLIKGGGQILGPFADKQVIDLLKNRVIVPLDEASNPCGRWQYIRDVPAFAKVVEDIRTKNLLGTDNTTTQGTDHSSFTPTFKVTNVDPDELTQDIPKVNTIQDVLFHSVDDLIKPEQEPRGEVFTHDKDLFIKQQAQYTSKWIWVVTSIIILFTTGFVIYRQFIAKPKHNKIIATESIDQAMQALDFGDYQRALENFRRAHSLDPNDASIYIYLGLLEIQIGEQPLRGRKLLEKIDMLGNRQKVLIGLGLSYLREDDINNAEKKFNKALEIDGLNRPALIDLGAAAMYGEDYAKAINQFLLVINENKNENDSDYNGAVTLLLVESFIKLYEKEHEKKYLTDAKKYLIDLLKKTHNYALEASVGLAYVNFLLEEKDNIYTQIDKILDMDTEETSLHKQNLLIDGSKLNWKLFSQWCLKFTSELDPNSHVIALEALCIVKNGGLGVAYNKISDAIGKSSKDPLVNSIFAIILRHMNSQENMIVQIDKAQEYNEDKYEQPLRLGAELCKARGDADCQNNKLQLLLSKNPTSLYALAELAKINLKLNDVGKAKEYLSRGQKLSSHYRPFLEIEKMVSKQEDRNGSRGL